MYNIHVLDHLLENADKRVELLVRSLTTNGEDERGFLVNYFSSGSRQSDLVGRLAGSWPLTLQFILVETEVDDATRTRLVNAALGDIVGGIDYEVEDTIREYFEVGYAELETLTSDDTSVDRADLVAKLFADANVRLADLSRVAHEVRRSMVAKHRYTISRENLVLALDGAETLALDEIRAASSDVYSHVLDNLPAYLDALSAGEPSVAVEKPEAFETVLNDVFAHDDGQLAQVISLSTPKCRVQDLTNVPQAAWPFLADGNRFPATFTNVRAYLGEIEQIDKHLAEVLKTAGTIETSEEATEADKAALAKSILQAEDVLPEPDLRTQLVVSLGLEGWLSLDLMPHESGELIGLLIAEAVVPDDVDTFAVALDLDWKTRESAMSNSKDFASYMTPVQVPVGDVAPLLGSEMVPENVKAGVLAQSLEFVPDDDRVALTALAQYALETGKSVAATELTRWALARVDAQLIVRLLERLLPQISEAELVPVLEAIGGDYAEVASRNGKRPKLANTASNLALVDHLQQLEIASSHEASPSTITVNMRKTP